MTDELETILGKKTNIDTGESKKTTLELLKSINKKKGKAPEELGNCNDKLIYIIAEGINHLNANEVNEAISNFEKAKKMLESYPGLKYTDLFLDSLVLLGEGLYRLEKLGDAREVFKDVLKHDPSDGMRNLLYARLLTKMALIFEPTKELVLPIGQEYVNLDLRNEFKNRYKGNDPEIVMDSIKGMTPDERYQKLYQKSLQEDLNSVDNILSKDSKNDKTSKSGLIEYKSDVDKTKPIDYNERSASKKQKILENYNELVDLGSAFKKMTSYSYEDLIQKTVQSTLSDPQSIEKSIAKRKELLEQAYKSIVIAFKRAAEGQFPYDRELDMFAQLGTTLTELISIEDRTGTSRAYLHEAIAGLEKGYDALASRRNNMNSDKMPEHIYINAILAQAYSSDVLSMRNRGSDYIEKDIGVEPRDNIGSNYAKNIDDFSKSNPKTDKPSEDPQLFVKGGIAETAKDGYNIVDEQIEKYVNLAEKGTVLFLQEGLNGLRNLRKNPENTDTAIKASFALAEVHSKIANTYRDLQKNS